jgi:metallo-beta-lactamase family protein
MAKPSVQFLGAAGTVTGSKHLIRHAGRQVMLDCGMFQGTKSIRERNWSALPFDPHQLDAIVLSHAHIDHTGHLPLVVRHGYRGPVYCTSGTADLLNCLLRDAAYLQEEQAERANRYGYSKHQPALPLYTMEDAEEALKLLQPRPYKTTLQVAPGFQVRFRRTGHILGSASVDVKLQARKATRLVFSGDVGRWDRPILRDPVPIKKADYLILESTYGNRLHPEDAAEGLAAIIRKAADRGGPVIIPAFAVGRTQEIVWRLRMLEDEKRIPVLPVYIDSPMAIDVTQIYLDHPEDHDLDMKALRDAGTNPLHSQRFTIARTVEASKQISELNGPFVVISASGMATGGRILHHLKRWVSEKRATVLLCGFQAYGTRGRRLLEGAEEIRIHGQDLPVKATIDKLNGLSAHADQAELLRWSGEIGKPPRNTFLVHGEPEVCTEFATVLQNRKWNATVAEDGATVELR